MPPASRRVRRAGLAARGTAGPCRGEAPRPHAPASAAAARLRASAPRRPRPAQANVNGSLAIAPCNTTEICGHNTPQGAAAAYACQRVALPADASAGEVAAARQALLALYPPSVDVLLQVGGSLLSREERRRGAVPIVPPSPPAPRACTAVRPASPECLHCGGTPSPLPPPCAQGGAVALLPGAVLVNDCGGPGYSETAGVAACSYVQVSRGGPGHSQPARTAQGGGGRCGRAAECLPRLCRRP